LSNANPAFPMWWRILRYAQVDLVGGLPPTPWLDQDNGHQGVWVVDRSIYSDMVASVKNSPVQNPYKQIWLQSRILPRMAKPR
jgi:hypothetical protein